MLNKNSITIPAVTIQLLKRNLLNYNKNYLLNIVLPYHPFCLQNMTSDQRRFT